WPTYGSRQAARTPPATPPRQPVPPWDATSLAPDSGAAPRTSSPRPFSLFHHVLHIGARPRRHRRGSTGFSPGARRVTLPRVVATTVGGRRSLLRIQARVVPHPRVVPVFHRRLERDALRLVLAHILLGGLPD